MEKKSKKNVQNAIPPVFESRPLRVFSTEFKREKVSDILHKRVKIVDICSLYKVSKQSVYRWIYEFSDSNPGTKMVVEMESEAKKTKELLLRVAELERVVGQKQLQIDYMEKMLELASESVGYDVKKNIESTQLHGFKPITVLKKQD